MYNKKAEKSTDKLISKDNSEKPFITSLLRSFWANILKREFVHGIRAIQNSDRKWPAAGNKEKYCRCVLDPANE